MIWASRRGSKFAYEIYYETAAYVVCLSNRPLEPAPSSYMLRSQGGPDIAKDLVDSRKSAINSRTCPI